MLLEVQHLATSGANILVFENDISGAKKVCAYVLWHNVSRYVVAMHLGFVAAFGRKRSCGRFSVRLVVFVKGNLL